MNSDTNAQQLQRERQQRRDGQKRLDTQHMESRHKRYVTSSPYVRVMAYQWVQDYAAQIQSEVQRRYAAKESTGHFEALKLVCDRFSELEPIRDETVEAPSLGFLIMSRTIWARVMDEVFTIGSLSLGKSAPIRDQLSTRIGEDLERTLKLRHYLQLMRRIDTTHSLEDADTLRQILMTEYKQIHDNNSSLDFRRGRAKDLLAEWDTGTITVRKGRRANVVISGIKPFSWTDEEWDNPWGDALREMAAGELLDMLVVPLNGDVLDPNDARPFYYRMATQGDKTPNKVFIRPHFENELLGVREEMARYVTDYLPMVTEPLPWLYTGKPGYRENSGGYATQELRALTPLVRHTKGEQGTIPSQLAVDLLNTLGRTEWRVDSEQLELVKHLGMTWQKPYDGIVRPKPWTNQDLQDGTGAAAAIPEVQYREAHKHELEEDRTAAETVAWKANNLALKIIYTEEAVARQRVTATATLLSRLDRLDGDSLWYPWSFDTRTRCYPIGGLGTPHGSPSERYTIEFAKGERLSESGIEWALRGIGAAALDTKGSVNSRIQWAKDNMNLIRHLAEGTDSALAAAEGYEEPLNLLALSRAWVQHENGGDWHKPVYVDGTCSGWQIVSALLGSEAGMRATNVWPATYDDTPADAYKLARNKLIEWIGEGNDKLICGKRMPSGADMSLWAEALQWNDSKLGRKLSKAFATTAVYGSGNRTQADDFEDVLLEVMLGMSSTERWRFMPNRYDKKVLNGLANALGKAFTELLGPVMQYNSAIKSMARNRILQGCPEELRDQFKAANKLNVRAGQVERVRLGRILKDTSTHGLKFTTPDGSVVDLVEYSQTVERYQTLHHGKPSYPMTWTDSWDYGATLRAAAPGVIHSLDSCILKLALSPLEIPVVAIHDAVGAHPNEMDNIGHRLRDAFLVTTRGDFLKGLADEWDVEPKCSVNPRDGWRDGIHDALLMFN
jgi:hypothetical protein